MIQREPNKIAKMASNPAAGILGDTIEHYGLSQAEVARGMGVRPSLLNETLKGKRGVSVDLAMRAEAYFGMSAQLLVRLQADYDFQKAYYARGESIAAAVKPRAIA
ncbi:hypothetical protein Rhal01_02810 [Rubritalea halochordaticola]|uniref:HTH cro/C1-type domain-containing protein n=1 Tax=Rubritalea halochordaticola TaxID=714537 RepID=A0ABP9V3Q0_9BACT